MTKRNTHNNHVRPRSISRREFIKVAAVAGLVAGCRAVEQSATTPMSQPIAATLPADTPPPTDSPLLTNTPEPTNTPFPTNTPLPADTAIPTSTPAPNVTPTVVVSRRNIIKMYPDTPSKVVHTHHAGVWDGDDLSPEAIRQMLDASITELTGLNDVTEAWAALFDPGERIAIKVSTINNSAYWTHVPLVEAVTEKLQTAGIPAEQIIIFDRYTSELANATFTVNPDGAGVRCYGTDDDYTAGWTIMDKEVGLSPILLNCDALINMPILKQHRISGVTFAMKNHYGTFNKPEQFHTGRLEQAVPELNALAPIKDRTRLIIGDALSVVEAGWHHATPGNSIFMSFDPVAHDAVGLQFYSDTMAAQGNDFAVKSAAPLANTWLTNGAELGLGSNDPDNMELIEVNLG